MAGVGQFNGITVVLSVAAVKRPAPLMVGFCSGETTGASGALSEGATAAPSTSVKFAVVLEFGFRYGGFLTQRESAGPGGRERVAVLQRAEVLIGKDSGLGGIGV